MKKLTLFISLLCCVLSTKLYAGYGIVLVLEAPLLLEPSLRSKISKFVRKGQKIFIHDKNFGSSPDQKFYGDEAKEPTFDQGENETLFLQTTDSTGRDVWIEKRFVKLIYEDERERAEAISPFEHDPKDYRIYEPIPETYPFYVTDRRRFYVTYGIGSSHKTSYNYSENVADEQYYSRHGINFYYLKKVDYDLMDRFYYGINLHVYGENNAFTLENDVQTVEFRGQLGIGPSITYDVYRKRFIDITFTTALTFNYDRSFVAQRDFKIDPDQEERLFESFSVTPKFGTLVTFKDILPFADIVLGSEIQFNFENKIQGSKDPAIDKFWNMDEDYIRDPIGATFAFNIGIVTTN